MENKKYKFKAQWLSLVTHPQGIEGHALKSKSYKFCRWKFDHYVH